MCEKTQKISGTPSHPTLTNIFWRFSCRFSLLSSRRRALIKSMGLMFIASCMLFTAPVTHANGLTADDSWLTQETPSNVNVAGKWMLQLCKQPALMADTKQLPDTEYQLSFTVAQQNNHIHASSTQYPLELAGTVSGHNISFSISGIENSPCLPKNARLAFTGKSKGAFITGEFTTQTEPASPLAPPSKSAFSVHIHREFMLSFDDGPLPGKTDRVLDTLLHYQGEDGKPVKAAFFMVGDAPEPFWLSRFFYAPYEIWTNKGSMKKYPELVNRVKNEGHLIGNHTAHHAWFRWPWLGNTVDISSELSEWEQSATETANADQAKLFRPPYLINTQVIQTTATQLNYQIVLGHTVGDATPGTNLDSVKSKILKIMETWDQSTPAVLIFHDIFPITYQHLDEMITHLKSNGYVLVHFK